MIIRADPLTIRADPLIMRADPLIIRADPLIIRADPLIIRADPLIIRADLIVEWPAASMVKISRSYRLNAKKCVFHLFRGNLKVFGAFLMFLVVKFWIQEFCQCKKITNIRYVCW